MQKEMGQAGVQYEAFQELVALLRPVFGAIVRVVHSAGAHFGAVIASLNAMAEQGEAKAKTRRHIRAQD